MVPEGIYIHRWRENIWTFSYTESIKMAAGGTGHAIKREAVKIRHISFRRLKAFLDVSKLWTNPFDYLFKSPPSCIISPFTCRSTRPVSCHPSSLISPSPLATQKYSVHVKSPIVAPSKDKEIRCIRHFWYILHLFESRRATTHHLSLAHKLGVKFGSVEGEVDVKVYSVECALWCVHSFKILLEVFARKIWGEGDNFLDTCDILSKCQLGRMLITYGDPSYILGKHRHHKRTGYPRT